MTPELYVKEMRSLGFSLSVVKPHPDQPLQVLTMYPPRMPTGKRHDRWLELERWRNANCTAIDLAPAINGYRKG
jgi:hypothetical protein